MGHPNAWAELGTQRGGGLRALAAGVEAAAMPPASCRSAHGPQHLLAWCGRTLCMRESHALTGRITEPAGGGGVTASFGQCRAGRCPTATSGAMPLPGARTTAPPLHACPRHHRYSSLSPSQNPIRKPPTELRPKPKTNSYTRTTQVRQSRRPRALCRGVRRARGRGGRRRAGLAGHPPHPNSPQNSPRPLDHARPPAPHCSCPRRTRPDPCPGA